MNNLKIKYYDEEIDVFNEVLMVENITFTATLSKIPSLNRKIFIKHGYTDLTEVETEPNINEFKVDRNTGVILFNSGMAGERVIVDYSAIGKFCVSADNVSTNIDSNGNVIETLEGFMQKNKEIIDSVNTVGDGATVLNQLEAHIESAKNLTGNIIEGGTLNDKLVKTINNGKNADTNLKESINSANTKISEMDQWINKHEDIVGLDNRVDVVETSIPKINEQLDNITPHITSWINVMEYGALPKLTDIADIIKNIVTTKDNPTIYIPNETFNISSIEINNKPNITIICEGTLKMLLNTSAINCLSFINCENLKITNINLNCNENPTRGLHLLNCNNYSIIDGLIENVGVLSSDFSSSGILIRGASNWGKIKDIKCKKIYSSVVGSGIWFDKDEIGNIPLNTFIDNVKIEDIHPIGDSDGIKILNGVDEIVNLTITNSYFKNCRKRAMKFQARGCCSINNVMEWDERGFVPIDFQRGYGSSLNDTIRTSWLGDGSDTQNGYFRALISVSKGYVNVDNLNYEILSDVTWLKNVNQTGAILWFNGLDTDTVDKVNVNNVKGGGAGMLFLTADCSNVKNCNINNISTELFYNRLFEKNVNIEKVKLKNIKLKLNGGLTFVNTSYNDCDFEIEVEGNVINMPSTLDLNTLRLITKGSTRVSDNLKSGKRTEWNADQIPSNYTSSQGLWFEKCRVGDICYKNVPTVTDNNILTEWICTAVKDEINPRGVWKPKYIIF